MKKIFATAVSVSLCCTGLTAQAQEVSEKRQVEAKVRQVEVDGVIALTLKQGATPGLTLYADQKYMADFVVQQDGDSLKIKNRSTVHIGKGPEMRAELVLPHLDVLKNRGIGSTNASGFSGEKIKLDVSGAGNVSFNGAYKHVKLMLSGVSKVNLDVKEAEHTEVKMSGAGSTDMKGKSRDLEVELSGVGALDAQQLEAQNLKLKLSGTSKASVTAKQSASVAVSGVGSAVIYGEPATRSSAVSGAGKLSWK
ncbi:DUF2807 domain-containing protein [Massilia sp. W12]|uniref:GIN domain-containing protein n=1 Tax=Massilia sp. W12 TaxID=3126507 RepID=UPI0030D25D66